MKIQEPTVFSFLLSVRRFFLLWLLPVIFMFSCTFLQAQVNNNGGAYISGNVYIPGTLTNGTSATYQNDGNLQLRGDFVNNQSAAMSEGTGTTQFINTSLQNLSGLQPSVFHNVSLSNPQGVLMNNNATMGGVISTITGSLYFNNYALTMGGKINTAYTNTSAFNVTPLSDLNITGAAASGNPLYFDASANLIHNVTVTQGASAVIGNALDVTAGSSFGTVTVNGTLNAAGLLTLKSDANGTAREAASSGTVSNFVTVERYVTPRRAWRLMSFPVNNDTLHIRTAWQEGVNNPSLSIRYNPHPGFGTEITGDNNTSLGYDYNTTMNPSLRTWVQSVNGWSLTTPPTVSTFVNDYAAYCFFVRGSRAVDLTQATYAIPDATVIRTTGSLNNNTWAKTFSAVNTGDWLFVGNPFASSIDISRFISTATGIQHNKFYVFDPGLSGTYGVGAYVTYDNGVMAPVTMNYPTPTTIIQDGQAFFVVSNSTSATVNVIQSDKTASEKNIFSRYAQPVYPRVYANLMLQSADSLLLVDGAAAIFADRFASEVDDDDAKKLPNFNENISFLRNESRLEIEARPKPQPSDTLFLRLSYLKSQAYILEIHPLYISDNKVQAWLVDKYTGSQTPVKVNDTTLYKFTANSDTASFMRRFIIVYQRTYKAVTAEQTEKTVAVSVMNIYPNPVTGGSFTLNLKNLEKGIYTLTIFSTAGKPTGIRTIEYEPEITGYTIQIPAAITAGVYTLQLQNSSHNTVKTAKIVVSK